MLLGWCDPKSTLDALLFQRTLTDATYQAGCSSPCLITDWLITSAPGGRGSAFILVVAKVRKKTETKEFYGIKFVNSLNNYQYTYSNLTIQYLFKVSLSTILISVILPLLS